MKPEAQRIAIAEACGFENKEAPKHVFYWYKPNTFPNGAHGISNLPDYLHDLNAMHEAECWLVRTNTGLANPEDLIMRYAEEINKSSGGALGCFADICATAAQRAEAFLKTIGKWEDGK